MTICIAAIASGQIIVCSESSGSTALGTDDAVITDESLPHGFRCLATGNRPEINDIVPEIAEQFIQLSKVDEGNIAGALLRALRNYRKAQIDEIFGGFGDIHGSLTEKASSLYLDSEFLVVGFVEHAQPLILSVEADWEVCANEDWAVIGDEYVVARVSLLQRRINNSRSLDECIYAAYEAAKCVERATGVAKRTSLTVYSCDGTAKYMDGDAEHIFAEKFAIFGSRQIKSKELELTAVLRDR
jgi:hypothetical protein